MAGIRPAFTISSRSSSSSCGGASRIVIGAFPWALNFSLSATQALVVTAEFAGEDFFARQVVYGGDRRRAGAGDQDLVDVHPSGVAEVDVLLQFGRDRDLRRNQVHLAVDERRQQHLARQRQEDHVDPVARAGLEALVEPCLHELAVLVRDAALHALVDEIERAIERHADPYDPSLDELVEVACKRLQHGLAYRRRQLGFELEGRRVRPRPLRLTPASVLPACRLRTP